MSKKDNDITLSDLKAKLKQWYRRLNRLIIDEKHAKLSKREKLKKPKESPMKTNTKFRLIHLSVIILIIALVALNKYSQWPVFYIECNPILCLRHMHSFEFYVESFVLLYICLHTVDSIHGGRVASCIERNFIPTMVVVIVFQVIYFNLLISGTFDSRYFTFELENNEFVREYRTILFHFIVYVAIVSLVYTESRIARQRISSKFLEASQSET